MKLTSLLMVGILLLVAVVACSNAAVQTSEPPPAEIEDASAMESFRPGEVPLIKGPLSPDGLQAIFATPDLGVGVNRVGFALTSPSGLVRTPAVTVNTTYFPPEGAEGEHRQTALAVFRSWPYGTRGIYTTSLSFAEPGRWGIDIAVPKLDGVGGHAKIFFGVMSVPSAPANGSPAVSSASKTLDDVPNISQLTTGSLQDAELYELTIADAVANALPTVVVMASPAFCTNAVCGPQVQVLQELKEEYRGQANFIHVDIYDNPHEIQGDLDRARISPTVVEWALPSTEWTFVIDRQGIVSARFESFATFEELEEALPRGPPRGPLIGNALTPPGLNSWRV